MKYMEEFYQWYENEFRNTELYADMAATREGSPYHREESVGVHTDMVVEKYMEIVSCDSFASNDVSEHDLLLGAFASAFHDVGKPEACEDFVGPDGTMWKRFRGHEHLSGRLWEDWALTNIDMLATRFSLSYHDIFVVGWMIQQHQPWSTKKIDPICMTVSRFFGHPHAYLSMLRADAYGRYVDEPEKQRERVESWCANFEEQFAAFNNSAALVSTSEILNDDARTMYLLIGPSGSGKSTFTEQQLWTCYSWDTFRVDWYVDEEEQDTLSPKEMYKVGFERSCEDKDFNGKCMRELAYMLKHDSRIAIDNTNLSPKRRRPFVQSARQKGFRVVGVVFMNTLDTVLDRQASRDDKEVPSSVVRQQYMSLVYPSYGEVDEIIVV